MARTHEQSAKIKITSKSFLSYPEQKRFDLEKRIREKRTRGEQLTTEEQKFFDAEHDFLASDDQPSYRH